MCSNPGYVADVSYSGEAHYDHDHPPSHPPHGKGPIPHGKAHPALHITPLPMPPSNPTILSGQIAKD